MGANDGDVPISVTSCVGIRQVLGKDSVPGAVSSVAAVAFPCCLPGAEVFSGQVAPSYAYAVPVHYSLEDPAIVLKRPEAKPRFSWKLFFLVFDATTLAVAPRFVHPA